MAHSPPARPGRGRSSHAGPISSSPGRIDHDGKSLTTSHAPTANPASTSTANAADTATSATRAAVHSGRLGGAVE
ncbi:hypothetical protein [Saccharothrix variisporea]|uniref:hypothetical protein n=1 Tax=Saccharothrix variisporea TaxID=543527 RepID=UPI000EB0E8D5|nr:hypothetical protein [Saccharothrix variisporea]